MTGWNVDWMGGDRRGLRRVLWLLGMPLTLVLVAIVRLYQLVLSPFLGARCKFHPSCSAYCVQALTVHGPLKGLILTTGRVCRCHPWQLGGLNPIPPAGSWRAAVDLDGNDRVSGGTASESNDWVGA